MEIKMSQKDCTENAVHISLFMDKWVLLRFTELDIEKFRAILSVKELKHTCQTLEKLANQEG